MSCAVNGGLLVPVADAWSGVEFVGDIVSRAASSSCGGDDAGGVTRTLTMTRSRLVGVMPWRRYASAIWEGVGYYIGDSYGCP